MILHLSPGTAQNAAQMFLRDLRSWVSKNNLESSRLPGWITAARVRLGWVNSSCIIVFEDTIGNDSYEIRGSVHADMVLLMNVKDYHPSGASLKARKDVKKLIALRGTYQEKNRTIFNLVGKSPAFFDCGFAGYHGPTALINILMQHTPDGAGTTPVAVRYIPFALYLHENDVIHPNQIWNNCEQTMGDILLEIHNSDTGSFYQRLQSRATIFALNKASGVIVLGKDTGDQLQELIQVRDYLKGKGYDAELIKNLPDIPMMSNEEKVRLWSLASRFVVMIDRVPAGHLVEYQILKEQRTITAFLRPAGSGSTYMIGDDALVDINYMQLFEFNDTALSILDSVKTWAEQIAEQRATAYNKAYPWRDKRLP